ncbi:MULTISPECIES: hypothetical protein [unclassified Brevibacterium]|uniref:hypothetical protein n=1 Tax=unclassified Brevibacterium TaxID=2614124 RepID=UPI00109227E4|nr:hypothetical protein [Brevibacterium sp. S22]TGD30429.1 hypothetical protein EB835_13125 [Brevibacterium sp. S22]
MTPIRRSAWMPRLLTAAAGTALALSLTACGGSGDDKPAEDENSEAAQTEKGGFGGGAVESEAAEAQGSEPAEKEPTDTKSSDLFADAAKTTNWASDDGMKIDKKGNGIVPAASIEADLIDLFENKLELKVKEAACDSDMELKEWYGYKSCQVTIKDKQSYNNEKKFFGSVKIVDHKDKMVKYELMFPGIDKEDFDFKD